MNDKDISKLNEAEFDELLLDLTDAPPPPEVSDELSPWRNAMSRIVWGIGWTGITLNFLYLDYLLPAVGMMMLLLGFRSLRRENRWFALGYGCAWVRLLWWLLSFSIGLTVFSGDAAVLDFQTRGAYAMTAVEIMMLLGLRNGIRTVQRKAGLPEEGGTGLLVLKSITTVLATLRLTGILALVFMVIFILTLRELYRLSKTMEEAGYAVSPAPVRISDDAAKRAYTAAIAVIALVCYLFLAKYPMDWKPAEPPAGTQAESVRQELLELGFPEDILNDLTEDEILACSGADFVLTESQDHQIDRKYLISLTGEQPENTLRITAVGLRFPGERDTWKLIHHFRWLTNDGFCGTEAIQMWPASYSGNWRLSGEFTGRVLYDHKGVSYGSGYHFLGTMTTSGWLGPSEDLYAAFSLPSQGENHRGYLIYDVTACSVPSASISSWFNYVHQYSRLQFPVRTAMQKEMDGSPNFGWGFRTEQTEFQINTYGEIPGLF